MKDAPEFKTGNKSFAKALNAMAAYARESGVNPAGRPGWSWSKDGWVPPYVFSSPSAIRSWDIIPVPDSEDALKMSFPKVLRSADDVTLTIAITGNSFVPAADNWIVLEILPDWTASINMVETWDSYPSCFEFDESDEFVSTTWPLYKLVGEEETDANLIADGVYALRYVGSDPLRATWATVKIPDSVHLRDALLLL